MQSQAIRLPRRFPVGTRYVVEGRDGRIHLRYLEFPDGRRVKLPSDIGPHARVRRRAPRRSPAGRK